MKTNVKRQTVIEAIQSVNVKYGYKLRINNESQSGKWYNFTIRSEKSGIPGSIMSRSGGKSISASWHAHGYLFDEIFNIDKNAVIISQGNKITVNGGNWIDIEESFYPCLTYMSDRSIL